MLCSVKFYPEDQKGYIPDWGVVYNIAIGHDSTVHEANKMDVLDRKIKAYYEEHRMTDEGAELRDKIIKHVAKLLDPVYPTGVLMCGGSTISRCGAVDSDMDLCYVVKTTINVFMIDRMALALLKYPVQIRELATVPARVPLVKGKMLSTVVDPTGPALEFELDIQCNCVAGVYLLGGFANCDERLPQLSMILKKWAKNVKIVDQNRFNSYTVTLLVVHFLQCGVYPPVLPNLIKLMPEQFDGNIEPWKLSTTIDKRRLPECKNTMSVGELFCAFFNYYNDFNFETTGFSFGMRP
ncbi:hypothetical protein M3Y99_01891700 [Aphelenchoides fujianensis]|nr:hypothetical protein M3Y99_01891700 [Aphelenchoides fujianensis]